MEKKRRARTRFRFQRFEITVLGLSALGHGLSIFFIVLSYDTVFFPFFYELTACVAASAVCSLASFFAPYREQYRFFHFLKAILAVLTLRLNANAILCVDLVPMTTLFVELALYEETRWGLAVAAAEIAAIAFLGLQERTLQVAAFYVFQAAVWFALAALTTHYRNRTIETEFTVRNYSNAFKKLAESNLGLQAYAVQAGETSAEQERRKISGALHDSIGYALTNIIAAAGAIELLTRRDPDQAAELAHDCYELSTNCLKEVRQTLRVLRSLKEEPPLLIQAIMRNITVFKATTGVEVEFNYGNMPWEFKNRALNQTLYRLVQEGLTNAFRHGKANFIRVTLWKTEKTLTAEIRDNGEGCGNVEEGIGIADLRERIHDLGGSIEAQSTADGFRLLVSIPLYEEDKDGNDTSLDSGRPKALRG